MIWMIKLMSIPDMTRNSPDPVFSFDVVDAPDHRRAYTT
jgi:hypothetical protein